MDMIFLYKGLILGFSVAAPIGPIGILCINRTINKGYKSGIVIGLGAATADVFYGLMAGLGLTLISNFLLEQKLWFKVIGLVFLVYLGIKTIIIKKKETKINNTFGNGLFKDYLTSLFFMVTNPMTILFFLAVFTGLGLSNSNNDKYLLLLGIFVGSIIWWLLLSGLTHKMKSRISNLMLRRIDILSGIIILLFAVIILFNLIKDLI